jgi:hypothetical protein
LTGCSGDRRLRLFGYEDKARQPLIDIAKKAAARHCAAAPF